jgi:hypothetical protein
MKFQGEFTKDYELDELEETQIKILTWSSRSRDMSEEVLPALEAE